VWEQRRTAAALLPRGRHAGSWALDGQVDRLQRGARPTALDGVAAGILGRIRGRMAAGCAAPSAADDHGAGAAACLVPWVSVCSWWSSLDKDHRPASTSRRPDLFCARNASLKVRFSVPCWCVFTLHVCSSSAMELLWLC